MADQNVYAQQQAAMAKQNEELAKQAERAKTAAEKAVDARAAAMEKQNAAYYERANNAQPTPTQRENDLAKVGALDIDDKEDDGSEWDDEARHRIATENLNNPYNVDATPPADRPRRGGKRGK